MTDLSSRLQAVLGDAFRVERELTGGGMSRLFLATEASLNRAVVIKVLPPEFTSEVSAARFKQEMEFAARLQHPHILPVLAAGATTAGVSAVRDGSDAAMRSCCLMGKGRWYRS